MRGNVSILAVLCAAAVCVQTAFGVAYDADTTVADAIPLDGEYEVEVASGVTVTYSGVITGTGPIRKKGAGTLVLTNPNNTFTAGVQISQGRVRADAEGCLGDGRIFIDGTVANTSNAKNGVTRQIRFNAVNATFANEILVEGKDPSAGYSPDNTFIDAAKSVTLTGPVTLTVNSNSGTCYSGISCGTTSDSSPVLHFTKPLTYTSGYLHIVSFGNMIFDEAVTVGTFVIGYNYQLTGTVCLNSPSNSFGTVTLAGSNLSLGDTNALGGATFGIARAGSG